MFERYDKVDGKPVSYIGDGVYAIFDGCGIWLHANDHRAEVATDKIYMEPEVLKSLNTFYENVVTEMTNNEQKEKESSNDGGS